MTDSTVTIKGEKKQEIEVKNHTYYRCERSVGSFTMAVALPCHMKADRVTASVKNWVLNVSMPKTEEARRKAVTARIDQERGNSYSYGTPLNQGCVMDSLADPRAGNDEGLILPPARTYEKVRRAFSGLVRAIYRLEVVGADHLPATGPAIVAPNHDSWLDGIILGAAVPRELRFVAKAELWRSRLLAWMLDGLGAIPIERGRNDYLAAARVLQALAAGQAVVIFPQGAVRGERVWQRGAAHAALMTGAPLVPVRLVGTARALSRGKIGFPRLRVIVGKPIEVARAPQETAAAAKKLTRRLRCAVESLA